MAKQKNKVVSFSARLKKPVVQNTWAQNRSVAVLLPCYNEELTIGETVRGFQAALPSATVYVYDNNSTDRSLQVAADAGAIVRKESYQGKGNVVRRMLSDVDADIYVLADGDMTYDPCHAATLIDKLVDDSLDMVVGTREGGGVSAYRPGHKTGNRAFNKLVEKLFGRGFTDILSGYRVLSRRFAKSFPALSSGFEIETELSVHALDLRIPAGEVALPYAPRPEGSSSKLRTWRDGGRILWLIFKIYRSLNPLRFYGSIGLGLAGVAALLGLPALWAWLETGAPPQLPIVVLCLATMQIAVLCGFVGIVLNSISKTRREARRMNFLNLTLSSQRDIR
ncbi:MAG: glycosyltransferase family 2 protein [Pseudomonadota bacterium]